MAPLSDPGYLGTSSVEQADKQLQDLTVSASQLQGIIRDA